MTKSQGRDASKPTGGRRDLRREQLLAVADRKLPQVSKYIVSYPNGAGGVGTSKEQTEGKGATLTIVICHWVE